jgi:hypothetical protein
MRASKVFKPTDLPESNSSGYPAPFRDGQRSVLCPRSVPSTKRFMRPIMDVARFERYGSEGPILDVTRLKP